MLLENYVPAGSGLCDTPASAGLSHAHVMKVFGRDEFNDSSPMADRLNLTTSVSSPGYLNVSNPCTSSDSTLVIVTPRIPSNAFQLPPLPHTSSLQLQSLLSGTVTTSPARWATSRLLSLQNITSEIENKYSNQGTASPGPASMKTRLVKSSPVIHTNNPYVPWTPETRREVFRPLAAHPPDCNSNARGYSHTILQLVPTSSSVGNRASGASSKRMRLSASLKSLTKSVSKNLRQVTKRMSKYKDAALTLDTSELNFASNCLSSNSFESNDATTLSTWLSKRQREQFESEKTSPTGMTLDEYEGWGSWTHLPQSALVKVDHFALLNNSSPSPRKSRSDSFLKSHSQSASSVTHSPRSLSLTRGTLSGRDREMRMPGGWTFG